MEVSWNDDHSKYIFIQGTSVFGIGNKACLVIPIKIIQGDHSIPTNTLIDSGAYDNFIHESLADQIDTEELETSIDCRNVDGTLNANGAITRYTWVKVTMEEQAFYIRCKVANLGYERIILGDTWLCKVNPQINWPRRKLHLPRIAY